MTDQLPALNEESGEEAAPEASPAPEEKATKEVAETEVLEKSKKPEETTEIVDESSLKKPKQKGIDKRIGQLTKRAKKAEAKSTSLADKLEEVTAQLEPQAHQTPQSQPSGNVPQPVIRPGEEIDANEFERRMQERDQGILQRTQALINFQGRVNRVVGNINKEAREVIETYPELNPNNDVFNKELSDAVTAATEAQVRANPTASVKGLVNKLMKPYKRAVTKEVGEAQENLAKQVSNAALKPTPMPKGKKDFENLSVEEMESELGTVC